MVSDLTDLRIKGWAYAERPTDYYEWLGEGWVRFKGDDGDHYLSLCAGVWHCDCARFTSLVREEFVAAFCQHTLGLERALPWIKPVQIEPVSLDKLPQLLTLA
jgi:hypothetical protein